MKTQTKTKTIIAVALTTLSIGSMLAGLYYYSARTKVKKTGGDSSSSSQTSPTAKISVSPGSLSFGEMEINASQNKSVAVKNTGGASLTLGAIAVTGSGFSHNGGTCASNQTLTPNVSCTATVQFSPTEEKDYSGTLTIKSNDVTKIVSLSGEGEKENGGGAGGSGGDSGSPDLRLVSFTGIGSSYEQGMMLRITVTITNQGNASTEVANACTNKQIAVKAYQGGNLAGTWYVSDLTVGQTLSYTFTMLADETCSLHSWCSFTAKVDADGCITESNEENNLGGRASMRGR